MRSFWEPAGGDSPRFESRDRRVNVLRFLGRRLVFFVIVGAVLGLSFLAWRVASRVSEFEEQLPSVAIEQVVDGRFLDVRVQDNTRDAFMGNPWLRLAMNEGYRAADAVRRYQMEEVWLQEGQHPETGEPAVIVILEPKLHEIPEPPFQPVAVRRWQPEAGRAYALEEVQEMRRTSSPNPEDLEKLKDVWSGHRYAKIESLFGSFRRVLIFTVFGFALMLVAGAYKTYAWWSTRWDTLADRARSDAALGGLQAARRAKESQDGLDGGY